MSEPSRPSLADLLRRVDALVRETGISTLSLQTELEGLRYDIAVHRLPPPVEPAGAPRSHSAALLASLPLALLSLNADGLIVEANAQAAALLGGAPGDAIGTSLASYVHPQDRDTFHRHCCEAWASRQARVACEVALVRQGGAATPVLLESIRLSLGDGGDVLSIVLTDVSPRRMMERRLHTTERDLRAAIDAARVTVWEWDIATNEVRWSDGVEQIFGLARGTFAGTMEAYRTLVEPDDLPRIDAALAAALDRDEPYHVEHRIRWPDSQTRWLQCHGLVIRDGQGRPLRMFGTVVDVTDRVRMEQALRDRLATSNARLLSAQEEERRRIARELHDDHCQQIVSLVLQLELVRKAHPRLEELPSIIQALKDLLQDLRYLVQGLHPPLLERQGLVAALRHHVGLFRARTGLSIRLSAGALPPLLPDQALCLFRVVQEALQNIVKHAAATDVLIDVRATPTAVVLTIQDNGRGYDVEAVLSSAAGLGLLGMRERVEQQRGTLTFMSAPGKGTTVTVRLPLSQG